MITFKESKRLRSGLYESDDGRQIVIIEHVFTYEIKGCGTSFNIDILPSYNTDEELEELFEKYWSELERLKKENK